MTGWTGAVQLSDELNIQTTLKLKEKIKAMRRTRMSETCLLLARYDGEERKEGTGGRRRW